MAATPSVASATNATANSASPSITHYHPAGLANSVIYVAVAWTGTSTINTTPTVAGTAMTSVSSVTSDGTSTSQRNHQWWRIKHASISGSGNLTVALGFSASNKWTIHVLSVCDVDQTTPDGTVSTDVHSGTDTAVSCAPSSSVGDLVLAGFSSGTGTPTADSGQTKLGALISVDTWGAVSSKPGAASSTTVGYSYASSTANAIVQAFAVFGASGSSSLLSPSGDGNRSVNINAGPDNPLAVGTLWKVPFGASTEEASGTGLSTSAPLSYAATLGKFSIYVSANTCSNSSTVTVYVNNSATSITITVPASTTGAFSDTSHTASVSAGDFISYATSPGTGSGTGSITVGSYALEVIPTDATKTISYLNIYSAGDSSPINTPTNATSYHTINGSRTFTISSESQAYVPSPIAGTLEKTWAELYAITAGSRHTLDVRVGPRINGANASSSWLQAPVSSDGWTAEHSGSDSISINDQLDFIVQLDAGEPTAKQFGIESIVAHLVNSSGQFVWISGKANGGGAQNAATTRYINISGEQTLNTTEAPATITVPIKCQVFGFWAHVISNTTTGGTGNIDFYVRKNGARSALRISVPRSSGDIYWRDRWNSLSLDIGDTISFESDAANTGSGSFRVQSIGLAVASLVSKPTLTAASVTGINGTSALPHLTFTR